MVADRKRSPRKGTVPGQLAQSNAACLSAEIALTGASAAPCGPTWPPARAAPQAGGRTGTWNVGTTVDIVKPGPCLGAAEQVEARQRPVLSVVGFTDSALEWSLHHAAGDASGVAARSDPGLSWLGRELADPDRVSSLLFLETPLPHEGANQI